jgi:hypothetical protein
VWLESSSDVEEHSEVLVGLVDGDDIHASEWESWVSSDLTVDLDVSDPLALEPALTIFLASSLLRAYFNLCWRRTLSGMHSLVLCGPADGLVA